jgi:hypothetical protein
VASFLLEETVVAFLSDRLKIIHHGQLRSCLIRPRSLAVAWIFPPVRPDYLIGLGKRFLQDVVEDSQITAGEMSGPLKPGVSMVVV